MRYRRSNSTIAAISIKSSWPSNHRRNDSSIRAITSAARTRCDALQFAPLATSVLLWSKQAVARDRDGRTVIETMLALRELGAAPVTYAVVHALFAGDAESAIREAGAARLASTNTVAHPTNEIDVVPPMVEPVQMQLRALTPGQTPDDRS